MEWYLEPKSDTTDVRRQIRHCLERSSDGRGLDDAEIIAGELLANVVRHTDSGAWVSLTWNGDQPVLEIRDEGDAVAMPGLRQPEPAATSGRGLWIASQLSSDFSVRLRRHEGVEVTATLPVRRTEPGGHPLAPCATEDVRRQSVR